MPLRLHRFLPRRPAAEPPAPRLSVGRLAGLGLAVALLGTLSILVHWLRPEGLTLAPVPPNIHEQVALSLGAAAVAMSLLLFARLRQLLHGGRVELGDLRAAAETLRGILGTTSVGVILADPTGRIRLFNPAAEILFGRLSDETLSLPVATLIPGLAAAAAGRPAADEATDGPRVRLLKGLRAGCEFPVRLLLRNLDLDGGPWLLILVEDLTETERLEARLDYLEHHDPLTGLNNRRTIERLVGASLANPARARAPHALAIIDIDHFMAINGACGHGAGDKLLKQTGQIITAKLPSAVAMARLGGDQFAALFVGEAVATAEPACEELVRTVRNFPFTWQDRSYDVSVSLGIAAFEPAEGALIALGRADIACQLAKARGGGQLHRYRPEDTGNLRRQGEADLASMIGRALDAGRFAVLAQPIRPLLEPGAPLQYEVLVRMRDDAGGLVVPRDFIPAAERYVLMPMVDRWVLAHLLGTQAERLRAWSACHPQRFLFAVNLSATTLLDSGFLPYLKRQFSDHRVPYPSICFEVSETAAVTDLGRVRAFMQSLCAMGGSFAVDDIGTGFASHTYIKTLPIRYLKIDGGLVKNMLSDPLDRAFVESVNHIAHVLGLKSIAEWAETADTIEALRRLGVDYAQGYGIGALIDLEAVRIDTDTHP